MIIAVSNTLHVINLLKMRRVSTCTGTSEPIVQITLDLQNTNTVIAKLASGALLAFNIKHKEKVSTGEAKKTWLALGGAKQHTKQETCKIQRALATHPSHRAVRRLKKKDFWGHLKGIFKKKNEFEYVPLDQVVQAEQVLVLHEP